MLLDSGFTQEKMLQIHDAFRFSCSQELTCFNSCCRNKDLLLTPYDVLRLKKSLNIHSDQLLATYLLYRLDPNSGFPVLTLKMQDAPARPCPFVGPQGCGVYADRPTACRLFPLGRATRGSSDQRDKAQEFYFMLDIPGCLGVKAEREITIKTWLEDQNLQPYLQMNNNMLDLVFHPERDRSKALNDHQLQNIIVACYNLDVFREFIFETDFLQSIKVTDETLKTIKQDDEVLLGFGFDYLRQILFH